MSNIEPRKRSKLTRNQRVDRGAQLVFATGVGAVAFVVTLVLAIVGVVGAGLPIALAVITAALAYAFRRTISG